MSLEYAAKNNRYLFQVLILLVNFYDIILNSTHKNLFCVLFNVKSLIRGWMVRFTYDYSSGLYEAIERNKKIFFKHTRIANGSYSGGFASRAKSIGSAYMLSLIKFNDGDLIIDCGANVGDLHLYFESQSIDVRLIAFEPSPVEYNCLIKNVNSSKCFVYNYGLWNIGSVLKFYVSSRGADSSLIEPAEYDEVVEVSTKRLDGLNINGPIKLLKIEAEGCEPEVLEGASGILHAVEYISADLGFERGINKTSTLVPVCNYLITRGFVIEDINFARLCVLFRNTNFNLI